MIGVVMLTYQQAPVRVVAVCVSEDSGLCKDTAGGPVLPPQPHHPTTPSEQQAYPPPEHQNLSHEPTNTW